MNQQQFFKDEHLTDSDSVLEELIDHIGDLLAREYFHLMEKTGNEKDDVIKFSED